MRQQPEDIPRTPDRPGPGNGSASASGEGIAPGDGYAPGPGPGKGTGPGTVPAARLAGVSLRHLHAFLAVADTLSFTDAAARMSSNQPALTRSIRRLEEHMGVRLFHRTTRQVCLTPAGATLREELQVLLPRFEKALFPDGSAPGLRLGFAWLLPDEWVHEAIRRFEAETGARVELRRCDDAGAGVGRATVDVAILRGRLRRSGVKETPLGTERYVAAVPRRHPLAARERVDWFELAEYPLVLNEVTGPIQQRDWGIARRPSTVLHCLNFDECIESVAAGKGISVVPDLVLRRNVHPSVAFVPLRGGPSIGISLIQPVQGSHPLADRFVRVVQQVLAPAGRRGGAAESALAAPAAGD
ncbi:LysR family transcriptional regulator [Streptomyces sp. NBC_00654]|uniref:LysR family transcriptional regulator n=1 Tax=Streptomyces sp. NBC_00654 TaxID=2975799 RepID=UPI0022577BCF|nr:LysR family transcriptional regulator [Streptomyces sp. NBC_00654]MCX4963676.1 LysR family transcriptional regulator [Streptomyces sp. NBC_00654]